MHRTKTIASLAALICAGFGSAFADASELTEKVDVRRFCAAFFFTECGPGEHQLLGPSPGGFDGAEAHADCRLCIAEFPCHSECDWLTADVRRAKVYADALAAAGSGDIERLLVLAEAADGYITVNQARHAVQLLSCDGQSVIATLPMGSP